MPLINDAGTDAASRWSCSGRIFAPKRPAQANKNTGTAKSNPSFSAKQKDRLLPVFSVCGFWLDGLKIKNKKPSISKAFLYCRVSQECRYCLSNNSLIDGAFFVSFFMLKSCALSFASRRLFCEERREDLTFCSCSMDLSI